VLVPVLVLVLVLVLAACTAGCLYCWLLLAGCPASPLCCNAMWLNSGFIA
jgi:hypothetical protein